MATHMMMEGETSLEEYDVKKTKSRTLLTNKKEVRPSAKATAKLEKLNHNSTALSKLDSVKDNMDFSTLKT